MFPSGLQQQMSAVVMGVAVAGVWLCLWLGMWLCLQLFLWLWPGLCPWLRLRLQLWLWLWPRPLTGHAVQIDAGPGGRYDEDRTEWALEWARQWAH
jgi:hypothetical protein